MIYLIIYPIDAPFISGQAGYMELVNINIEDGGPLHLNIYSL